MASISPPSRMRQLLASHSNARLDKRRRFKSTGSRLEVQRPSPGLGRVFGVAKPAPGRGQYPFRRRLGPLHQERDQSHDVGPARLNQWWRSDRLGSVLIKVFGIRFSDRRPWLSGMGQLCPLSQSCRRATISRRNLTTVVKAARAKSLQSSLPSCNLRRLDAP
jgi:hypothetical protein